MRAGLGGGYVALVDSLLASTRLDCPVRVLNRYADRVPAIHVKDVYSLEDRGLWTAVGTGVVPIQPAMRAAEALGIAWAVVEQDRLRNLDGLETAAASAYYLREHQLVAGD